METTIALKKQNESLGEWLIGSLKDYLVVKPLQKFLLWKYETNLHEEMRSLPKGTVGRDVADLLDKNDYRLIPKYESHDLKHLILGYGMTTLEELQMQFFLFGNGNRSLACLLFISTAVILPKKWKLFYTDYLRGKNTSCILEYRLQDVMFDETKKLKQQFL